MPFPVSKVNAPVNPGQERELKSRPGKAVDRVLAAYPQDSI